MHSESIYSEHRRSYPCILQSYRHIQRPRSEGAGWVPPMLKWELAKECNLLKDVQLQAARTDTAAVCNTHTQRYTHSYIHASQTYLTWFLTATMVNTLLMTAVAIKTHSHLITTTQYRTYWKKPWTMHLFCCAPSVFPNICGNISRAMKTLKMNYLSSIHGPLQKMVEPILSLVLQKF